MDIDEIRKLLPFYEAGTLDEDNRKRVREALDAHPELRKEFGSETISPLGVNSFQDDTSPGHLSSEQIVTVAEESLDAAESISMWIHLDGCEECRRKVETVRTRLTPAVQQQSRGDLLKADFRLVLRPVIYLPALAVLIASILLFLLLRHPAATDENNSLLLSYATHPNGSGKSETPVFTTDGSTTQVHLLVTVPHSTIPNRYTLSVRSPFGAPIRIIKSLPASAGESYDTLHATIDAGLFTMEGQYSATAREATSSLPKGLPPQEFFYLFRVSFHRAE